MDLSMLDRCETWVASSNLINEKTSDSFIFSFQIIIQRGSDGGFGFSVTGTAPVTVSSVQPSK